MRNKAPVCEDCKQSIFQHDQRCVEKTVNRWREEFKRNGVTATGKAKESR